MGMEDMVPGRRAISDETRGEVRLLRKAGTTLHLSERRLLLAAGDLLVLNATLAAALYVRTKYGEGMLGVALPLTAWKAASWFLLLSSLWLAAATVVGVYELALAARALHSAWVTGRAALLTGAFYLLIPYVTPALPQRRLELALFPLLAGALVGLWRYAYAWLIFQPAFDETALVVGAGWAGQTLARAIAEGADTAVASGGPYRGVGYRLLGFVDDDLEKQGQLVEGVQVIGTHDDLLRLARTLQPDKLIVAITDPGQIHPDLHRAIVACAELGMRITPMPDLYERLTGRVPVEHAGGNVYVAFQTAQSPWRRMYEAVWRLVETGVALTGCAAMGVVIPFVWLANQISSPGPLLYRQERVGQGGRSFWIVKFRSMVPDAEQGTGAVWSQKEDTRITPVGWFLRKTRLDELPQCWSVLKGEMALIGPRPERPEFVAELAQRIPYYRARHAVRPGLTGWAQVMYGYGNTMEDAKVKLEYDLYYIKHRGAYLDLAILLRTIRVVLRMEGH